MIAAISKWYSIDVMRKYFIFSLSIVVPALFALFSFKLLLSGSDATTIQLISYSWVFFSLALNFDFGLGRVLARQYSSIEIERWDAGRFVQFSIIVQSLLSVILFLLLFAAYWVAVFWGLIKFTLPFWMAGLTLFAGLLSSALLVLVRYLDESNGRVGYSSLAGGVVGSIVYVVPTVFLWLQLDGYFSFCALHFSRLLVVALIIYWRLSSFNFNGFINKGEFTSFWRGTYSLAQGSFLTNLIALFMSFSDRVLFSIWMPADFSVAYNAVADLCGRLALIPSIGVRVAMRNIDEALIGVRDGSIFLRRGYNISLLCVAFFIIIYYPLYLFFIAWFDSDYRLLLPVVYSIVFVQILFSSVILYSHSVAVSLRSTNRAAIIQFSSLTVFLILAGYGLMVQSPLWLLLAAVSKVFFEIVGFYCIYARYIGLKRSLFYFSVSVAFFVVFFVLVSFVTEMV